MFVPDVPVMLYLMYLMYLALSEVMHSQARRGAEQETW
jgi:hypothetical protein